MHLKEHLFTTIITRPHRTPTMSTIYTQDNLVRKNERAAILNTPARYIGNVHTEEKAIWVHREDGLSLENIPWYNEGIERCFVELLSNAVDNAWRTRTSPYSPKCKATKISVKIEGDRITIHNDGNPLPAREMEFTFMHSGSSKTEVKTLHPVTYYFGSMRTSTNYRADEERSTTGLHGMGAKVVNVLSHSFKVSSGDPLLKKKTYQSFSDHLNPSRTSDVSVTAFRRVNGYTEVVFELDESLFPGGRVESMIPRVGALLINCSLLSGLKTELNGRQLTCSGMTQYAKMLGMKSCLSFEFTGTGGEVSSVCIGQSSDIENSDLSRGFLSFVNGLDTYAGGVHIDSWKAAILGSLVTSINTSNKAKSVKRITKSKLDPFLFIVVALRTTNPSFVGDTKERLISPKPSTRVLKPSEIKRILGWSFYGEFIDSMTIRAVSTKPKRERNNLKLGQWGEDAPKAGTRESSECTLLMVEGLSAKTMAVMGYASLPDSAYWGCLVLRGKVMNAQKQTQKRVNDNTFLGMFRDMLGIRQGVEYNTPEAVATLRYGRIMIFCDADEDGNHIAGLVLSLFAGFYPYLLSSGFVTYLSTPIMKAYRTRIGSNNFHDFYTLADYTEWKNSDPVGRYITKHFKGLATSTKRDMVTYFRDPKLIKFTGEEGDCWTAITKAFGKSVLERKKWLMDQSEKDDVPPEGEMHPRDFIDTRVLTFFKYSLRRSIKALADGLKDCQRKALFTAMKSGMQDPNKQTRVSVLASRAVLKAHYDHGESSLADAIIRMAQGFLGSNNIPLFAAIGGFGSRLGGRDSAAQARYPFVYLEPIVSKIFREEDEQFYEYNKVIDVCGEKKCEPKFFSPVIPFFLCNDGKGIGAGFSMNNPPYNPMDIMTLLEGMVTCYLPKTGIYDKEQTLRKYAASLLPFWRGFKGTVVREGKRVIVTGLFDINHTSKTTVVHVTELPPGVWTDTFKRFLEDPNLTAKGTQRRKKVDKFWNKFTYVHSDTSIDFTLHCPHDDSITSERVLQVMGKLMRISIPIGKLEYLTAENSYGSVTHLFDLVDLYLSERYEMYERRIGAAIDDLERRIEREEIIIEFIGLVQEDKIDMRLSREEIESVMEERGLKRIDKEYDTLFDLKFSQLTKDALERRERVLAGFNEDLKSLKGTTAKELWIKEIGEVREEYTLLVTSRQND